MSSEINPSTVSFQSTTTVSSSSPLNTPPRQPPKDYEAALGTLQSRYGTGGILPSPKKEPSKKLPTSPHGSPSTSQTPSVSSGQLKSLDSQTTLASTSTVSESGGSSGGTPSARSENGKKKSTTGSILKSLFKGKSKAKEQSKEVSRDA